MKAFLELPEVVQLEKAASNLRDKLLIRVLFHLACLITEALSIAVKDIDFDNGTVTIIQLKASLRTIMPHLRSKTR